MHVVIVKSANSTKFDVVGPFVSLKEVANWVQFELPPGVTFSIGRLTCPDCYKRQMVGQAEAPDEDHPVVRPLGGIDDGVLVSAKPEDLLRPPKLVG